MYSKISIHALREERDNFEVIPIRNDAVFQSTRSARSATVAVRRAVLTGAFQSTRSARSATVSGRLPYAHCEFQSTRSARSATSLSRFSIKVLFNFNPRAPRGARRG